MTALRGDGRGLPRRIRLILFAAAAALLLILFRQALGQLLWQIALAVLLAYAARPICARFERRLPPGAAASGSHPIHFVIRSTGEAHHQVTEKAVFLVPR